MDRVKFGSPDPYYDFNGPLKQPAPAPWSPIEQEMLSPSPDPGFAAGNSSDAPTPNLPDPQDENSEANHPFAIQVAITASTPSSKSWSASVTVLSGKYQTEGDTQYTAAEVTETFTTASGVIKPYVYLLIPLESNGSGGWRAINGGEIRFGANRPVAVWPQVYLTDTGDYATAVQIGAWTIQVANISSGVPTYAYRAVVNQIIAEDYVLTQIELVNDGPPHAFKPTLPAGGNITITSGFVNSLPVTGTGSTTWSVGSAYKYWVKTTTSSAGVATSAEVERGTGSVPSDSATEGYQILFEVDTVGNVTTQHVFSSLRHQRCGSSTHIFGGLGS